MLRRKTVDSRKLNIGIFIIVYLLYCVLSLCFSCNVVNAATGPELPDAKIDEIEIAICDYQFKACEWNTDILAEVVMEQLKNEGYQVSAVIPEKIIFI